MLEVKVFHFESHGLLDMLSLAIKSIHPYAKKHDIGAIALQPRKAAEKYLRETIAGGRDFKLENAGHDIVIARYSQLKGYPMFCISRELFGQDFEQIRESLSPGKVLACAVEKSSLEYFLERFSEMPGVYLR